MKDRFVIGSRGSRLALWQSEWVRGRLAELRPGVEVRVEVYKTSGDIHRDVPLAVIGGKGAFTKELEEALLDGRIDIAVHSLKDLPTTLPAGLVVAAVPAREDARDALVLRRDAHENPADLREVEVATGSSPASAARGSSPSSSHSLKSLPAGAVVGTSSLRRQAQLRHLRPDVMIRDVRGNVGTRLRKLDAGEFDALLLASAGLRRLGLAGRISAAVGADEMLSAVGQGALGVETRENDAETRALVAPLEDAGTRAATEAERALLAALGGGCQVPIAAHAALNAGRLRLDALVAALDGSRVIRGSLEADPADAARAGVALAARLREQGADELLKGLTT